MRSLACLVGLVLFTLVVALPTGAQDAGTTAESAGDAVDCVNPEFLSNALIECESAFAPSLEASGEEVVEPEFDASSAAAEVGTAEAIVFPEYCRLEVDAVFWAATQWLQLAEGLGERLSPCAEYYVSIPPDASDLTDLRAAARFAEVRGVDARIHPVAEIRYTAANRPDWRDLALSLGGDLDDFFDAGVEARRRMAMGSPPRIDVAAGETWAFNELTPEVIENAPRWRAEVLAFLRGLYDGGPNRPNVRGIVFNIGPFSNDGDLADYKGDLQEWLADEAFWTELNVYTDFFAQEVYANVLNWGEAGAPLAMRADSLNDYFHHVVALAEAGPEGVEAARAFLRRTYLPLANAAWRSAVIGNTNLIDAQTMARFISTQVYAVRHYANSHPQSAPQGRIGFAWAPTTTDADRDLILQRLARAIQEASDEGTNSQMGACGRPGEQFWCNGAVEGAKLTDAWEMFAFWD